MILVDSSVWINHLRTVDTALQSLLDQGRVVQHPMVTAELALGSLKHRTRFIALLENLPNCDLVTHANLLDFIEKAELAGRGIGLIDAHILASAHAQNLRLWTFDKRLEAQAQRLGCHHRD